MTNNRTGAEILRDALDALLENGHLTDGEYTRAQELLPAQEEPYCETCLEDPNSAIAEAPHVFKKSFPTAFGGQQEITRCACDTHALLLQADGWTEVE